MATLSIRLPDSIHKHVKLLAERDGISINQFISSAAAEKLAALAAEDYIQLRAARASRSAFDAALDEAPDVPDKFDQREQSRKSLQQRLATLPNKAFADMDEEKIMQMVREEIQAYRKTKAED